MAATATLEAQAASLAALAGVPGLPPPAAGAPVPPRLGPDATIAALGGAALPTYAFDAAAPAAAQPPRLPGGGGGEGVSVAGGDDAPPRFGWDAVAAGGELLRGRQDAAAPGRALLDALLLTYWEAAAAGGLFRYDVLACPTKLLPGACGFVAQLNEGRATKKRPTEFKLDTVVQPFDGAKFNFSKASAAEVLFVFEAPPPGAAGPAFSPAAAAAASPNAVLVNVSPIDYGHALLCPRVLDRLPQLLDAGSLLLALRFAREAGNPFLRVGYNSLGAYATINHLHFQCYYLNTPMPIERAPTAPLPGAGPLPGGVRVARLAAGGYPVAAFVLESPTGNLPALAAALAAAAGALQAANVPHNLLISECGGRVFLTPQCYAEKQAKGEVPEHLLATGVNPAVWEITGHMVLFREGDYAGFTQELAWELLAAISLTEGRFTEVGAMCFGGGGGGGVEAAAANGGAREAEAVAALA